MLKKLWALAALAGTLSSAQALALSVDTFDRTLYVSGFGLFEIPQTQKREKDSYGYRAVVGYPFGVQSSLEVSYFDARMIRHFDHRPNFDSGLILDYAYDFGLLDSGIKFLPDFKPYLIGGAGLERDDENGYHGYYHPAVDAGGGLLFPISLGSWNWGWSLRAEARAVAEYVDNTHTPDYVNKRIPVDFHLGLGLTIPLAFHSHYDGHPMTSLPDCETAVVSPITGRTDCIGDADGDGVTDDKDQCPGTPAGMRVNDKGCPVEDGNDEDGDGVLDSDDQCPNTQPNLKIDTKGCAIEQTVVLEDVTFESSSAVLTGDAKKILDGLAQSMLDQKNFNIEIDGYTDNAGSRAYNIDLSKKRAESVREYLIGKNVNASRMTTEGYGESKAITSNSTDNGRASNRRVEFHIIPVP